MNTSNADDVDMLIRRPKNMSLEDTEGADWNRTRTTWSTQHKKREQRTFGRSSRLQRRNSMSEELFSEQSGVLGEDSLDSAFMSFASSEEGSGEFEPPPRPVRSRNRMSRSATLPTMPTGPPSITQIRRKSLHRNPQRSNSIAFGSFSGGLGLSRSSHCIPPELLFTDNQNHHPNFSDEIFDRDKKKPRARRASTLGSIPSLSSRTFQEEIASLHESCGGAVGPNPFTYGFAESPGFQETSLDLFGSPSSKSSSRKRPVCDSPSSADEGSIAMSLSSNTSSRRSRTRTRSPGKLPQNLTNPLFAMSKHSLTEVRDKYRDSDDDESEHNSESFQQDASFVSNGDTFLPDDDGEEKKDEEEDDDDFLRKKILKSKPAADDIGFLIDALDQAKKKSFFGTSVWNVIPSRDWHSARRASFFKWLVRSLDFQVSALGNGVTVLKIPAGKGQELLDQLRCYTKDQNNLNQSEAPSPSQVLIATSLENLLQDAQSCAKPRPMASAEAGLDFGLTSRMKNLTVEEPVEPPQQGLPEAFRASIGSARHSLDHSVYDRLVLPGHETPAHRASQMVLASTCQTKETNGRNSSIGVTASEPSMQTLESFETPQIKQEVGWGSRPVPGRDWGTSDPCDEGITANVEKSLGDRGEVECRDGLPRMPMADDVCSLKRGRPSHLSIEEVSEEQDSMMEDEDVQRTIRRRRASMAKYNRVSMYLAASADTSRVIFPRKSTFTATANAAPVSGSALLSSSKHTFPEVRALKVQETMDLVSFIEDDECLLQVFSFLNESELMRKASLVCSQWYEVSTTAYARLMMASVGYIEVEDDPSAMEDFEDNFKKSVSLTSRSWNYLTGRFPWGVFLSEGGFKRVYKVHNTAINAEEAISVMDVEAITDKKTIAAELVVSALLSSIARRGICPNFVITRGVFTLPYEPPCTHWGSEDNKNPMGFFFNPSQIARAPREPKDPEPGRYQFIRMELCNRGDAEGYICSQPSKQLDPFVARCIMFQIAFALHIGAERFSLKHYDIKLLNVFIHALDLSGDFVLRYGVGAHKFALRMPCEGACIAKLADYGTASIRSEANGQPVTVAQFTTVENTPPEFMILGDSATQGHGHDNWGLGLCMLHLYTGRAPYEEVLEEVRCPPVLKKKLKRIWENKQVEGFSVIRSVIRADVYEDGRGNILEGEPDETLYDTLYRYLVLFGIPEKFLDGKAASPVWRVIVESLKAKTGANGRRRVQGTDANCYESDCRKFSILHGQSECIKRARQALESMEGGMDLLLGLCSYDPSERRTALQVLNSSFMSELREISGVEYDSNTTVHTYNTCPVG